MQAFAVEASRGLQRLAEPITAGDRVKAQIGRAARRAGLPYSRAFNLWYGRANRIEAHELEAIRDAQIKRTVPRKADELRALAAEFETFAERAARVMAGSDRQVADGFRNVARRARALANREA